MINNERKKQWYELKNPATSYALTTGNKQNLFIIHMQSKNIF